MTTIFGQITGFGNDRPLQTVTERAASEDEALRKSADNLSAKIRVAMPAQVVSFDAAKQTIVAQPLVREKIIDRSTGTIQWIQIPQILDVPLQFPQGGDFCMTFPVAPGDEVLLVFNDMCFDSWWANGGVQNWNDKRRHDLSDAIAIAGINSVPNVISNIASDAAEIRTKDGQVKVQVKSDSVIATPDGGTTKMEVTAGQVHLKATTINLEGTINHVLGGITYPYLHHIHSTPSGPSGGVTEVI